MSESEEQEIRMDALESVIQSTVQGETEEGEALEEYEILIEHDMQPEEHMETTIMVNPFTCPICDRRFTRKGDMLRHHRKHTGEKPYSCPECADEFSRKDDMARHLRGHQGIKPHECPVCNQRFGRKTDMVKHLLIHAGIKACGCPTCGCPFSHQGNNKNVATCAFNKRSKIFECPECEETFTKKKELTMHYKASHVLEEVEGSNNVYLVHVQNAENEQHTEETEARNSDSSSQNQDPQPNLNPVPVKIKPSPKSKKMAVKKKPMTTTSPKIIQFTRGGAAKPFSCPQCQETFSRKADMVRHLMLHSGVKPFKCPHCPRAFTRKDDLTRHILTHSNVRPYQCNVCDKGFIRKSEFATHMINHKISPNKVTRVKKQRVDEAIDNE